MRFASSARPRPGGAPLRAVRAIKSLSGAALVLGVLAAFAPRTAYGQSAADSAAIRASALDYIEGWYAGDPARMERALHPDLAKRIVRADSTGASRLEHMDAQKLVAGTREGWGKRTPPEKRQKDVTILDVFENAASVKVIASDWVDYLHLARFNGRWVIVNVLWELKPRERQTSVQSTQASS